MIPLVISFPMNLCNWRLDRMKPVSLDSAYFLLWIPKWFSGSLKWALEDNLRIYFLKSRVSYCCRLYMTCFKSFLFFSIQICLFVYLMVLNGTFSNISAISWLSVLLVEETGGPGENHRPVASHRQTLSYTAVHFTLIVIPTHISGDRHWLHR